MGTHLPHKTSIQAKRMYELLLRQTTTEGRLLALGQSVNDQTLWQMIVDVEDRLVTLIATEMEKEIKLIKCDFFHGNVARKKPNSRIKQGKAQASSSSLLSQKTIVKFAELMQMYRKGWDLSSETITKHYYLPSLRIAFLALLAHC